MLAWHYKNGLQRQRQRREEDVKKHEREFGNKGFVGGEKQSIWLKKMMILNSHNSPTQSTAARALLQHFDV